MKRIAVGTSTGCLDIYNHNLNIEIIRLTVNINGNDYLDGQEIYPHQFYQTLRENNSLLPKTSQPSTGYLLAFFEKLIQEGYEEIYVSTLSSKLSNTYNGIVQVSQILKNKAKIHVFDTKTVCFNEGYFAIKTAQMLNDGKSYDEIISALTKLRDNNTIYFGVNSLEFLVKNGRLSNAAGFLGTMFKIKPILQVVDGQIISTEKVRTTKKSLEVVAHRVKEYINDRKASCNIVYTGTSENHQFFVDKLKEIVGLDNLLEVGCSCVVGSHVGGDIIGIGIFIDE